MKDTVISAVAAAAFLLLFVNGLRIILQKSVIRAVQKVQVFSIPKLQLTLPSKSDIGAYVEGLIGTASSRPLDTLVLAVISSMPLMVRYADRWPWRLRLVCAVAVSLAYACFTIAHINRGMASRDSGKVVMCAFWAYFAFILVGLGAVEVIARAAAEGTPSLAFCAVFFGWVPLCLLYLTKRLLDRYKGFLPRVAAVVVSLSVLEVLLRLWFFSCLEGIGAVPSDVFEGTPKDMLVRAIVIGGNPPLQHGSHQFHLIYDIIRSIQFAVATIFLSVPGNQLSGRDGRQ